VEETIILGPIYIRRDSQRLSSVPLLEMEAHPLKNLVKAVIRLYVRLSAL